MAINLSVKHLRAFIALAEHRHFTRAARHCHLSQPAFSALIRRLEEDVGTRLFERTTRYVTPTPEGELFLEASRHLVSEIEWSFADLQDYVARKKGRVSIAALPSIAAEWLPRLVAEYRRLYPGVTIEIHDVLSGRCIDLLSQGRVDMALAAPVADAEDLIAEPFFNDRFFLVCRRDHPLAGKDRIRLRDLAGHDFVRLADATSVQQHLAQLSGLAGLRTPSFQVENLATVAAMIVNGLGVSLLPELTLSQFRDPSLTVIPVSGAPYLRRRIHLLRARERPLSVAARAMWELFREHRDRDGRPAPFAGTIGEPPGNEENLR